MTRSWVLILAAVCVSCSGVIGVSTSVPDAGRPGFDAGRFTTDSGAAAAAAVDAGQPETPDAGTAAMPATDAGVTAKRDAGPAFDGGQVFTSRDAGATTATTFELSAPVSGTESPLLSRARLSPW